MKDGHLSKWAAPGVVALAVIGLAWVLGSRAVGNSASADPSAGVNGVVRLLDGRPAVGAWVRVQTTENLTYAAPDGSFALSGLAEGVTITITAWYTSYKVGWAVVVPPTETVTITLKPYDARDDIAYAWNTSYPDPANPTLGCGTACRLRSTSGNTRPMPTRARTRVSFRFTTAQISREPRSFRPATNWIFPARRATAPPVMRPARLSMRPSPQT